MSVAVAARTVIDLGQGATVLDAMERLGAAPEGDEVVLVVAAGAPLFRSAVFLDVLRRADPTRRLAIVSGDARARSLAASVHVSAFATMAALERHEPDVTEPLTEARRTALAHPVLARRRGASRRRLAVMTAGLAAAGLVLLAVVLPSATVVVAPVATALGPLEFDLRAGPGGELNAQTLVAPISVKLSGTATGSRTEDSRATGIERFRNQTTNEVRLAKGTIVRTPEGVRFQTTEERTLPRSAISLVPPGVTFGTVDVAIEAIDAGSAGNVDVRRIVVSPNPSEYSVENPSPTSGGDSKKIPIVTQADYDAAAARGDAELKRSADQQVDAWRKQAPTGNTVYGVVVKRTSLTAASERVGTVGQATFTLDAAGSATGYSVAASEPRAATLAKLRVAAAPENDIDTERAAVDVVVGPQVGDDGVHWRVRGRTSQYPRVNEAVIRTAVAGRPFKDALTTVRERGLQINRIDAWPSWWPRLPVLDARIEVRQEPAVVSP